MKTAEQINWKTTESDNATITAIVKRTVALAKKHGVSYDTMTARMDLVATHGNGCALDLAKLLAFDDLNFSHDVFGIARHINRETGQLEDFFVPRCAL